MKHKAKYFITVIVFALTASSALAQMVAVRDEASVDVPKGFFGASEPSLELKEEARKKAVESAWRRYQAQNLSGARATLFAQHKDELLKQAKELCNFFFYDERFDKEAATFSVKVRGSCDQQAIDANVRRLARGKVVEGGGGQQLRFVFMFLARRAAESTIFHDVESDSVPQTAITQPKGKIERRDTAYRYKVEQSESVDNAVTNVLTTSGFEVVKYSDLLAKCPGVSLDEVVVTFTSQWTNQAELVPAGVREQMIKPAKDCEMEFFAVGLLDIRPSERMPDGTERVTVALTIDVRDIRKKVPTAVAAIAAKQYQAIGHDRLEAANTALKMAADYGAREIVDMLLLRGIQ